MLGELYRRIANTSASQVAETVFTDREIATIRACAPAALRRACASPQAPPTTAAARPLEMLRPGHAKKLLKVAAYIYDGGTLAKRQRLDDATPLTVDPLTAVEVAAASPNEGGKPSSTSSTDVSPSKSAAGNTTAWLPSAPPVCPPPSLPSALPSSPA